MAKYTGKDTITGIKWNFIRALTQLLISFFVGIVLARLIDPEDFGLFAITVVFIGFSAITSSLGVTPALIQRKRISYTSRRVSMTLTILIGLLFYIIFWALAPLIASFFHIEKLTLIIRVISIIFITKGFSSYSRAMLIRYLRFKEIFITDSTSQLFGYSLVSVVMAIFGFGVWSLVGGILVGEIIATIFLLCFVKLPGKPLLAKDEAGKFLKFGGVVGSSVIFNYLANSLDNLIIGKFLSPRALGFYNRAYQLMRLPLRNVAIPISEVLFPSYSGFQDNISRVKNAYHRSINAVSLISYPILTSMAICSRYIIVGLYGPNWEGAVTIFRILCIAGIFKLAINLSGPVTKATGNIFAEAWRQFIFLTIIISGSLLVVQYGIEMVGSVIIIASFVLYLLMADISIKILKSSWKNFIKSQIPGIFISLILLSVSLTAIFLIEKYMSGILITILFVILVILLSLTYIICILLLPSTVKGEIPVWLYNKYKEKLPRFINRLLLVCFNKK